MANGTSGLSDTGLIMRALSPVDNESNGSYIHAYEGSATVVDTRVVCIRPNITNLQIELQRYFYEDTTYVAGPPIVFGDIGLPSDLLNHAASSPLISRDLTRFRCGISHSMTGRYRYSMYHPSDWTLTRCQLNNGGGVLSPAFVAANDSYRMFPDHNYLLMNYTSNLH